MTEDELEALATIHLHPQTQAGGEVDLMPLLRAVEAAERERCAMRLQVTRADVSLAAGELSAQEWRTCCAVLCWMQSRIRGA